MKKKMRRIIWLLALVCMTALSGMAVFAEEAGWNTQGDQIWYCLQSESGLERASGLTKIAGKYYYFNADGLLQTGWQKTEGGYRYFYPKGAAGKAGRMLTGLRKIGGSYFYLRKASDALGVAATGFTQVNGNWYFFRRTGGPGTIGAAYTKKWVKVKGEKRYFDSKGRMVTDGWVKNTYYVDEEGKRLADTITPDGYVLGSNGKKTGEHLTVSGWTQVSGKWLYYSSKQKGIVKSKWIKTSGLTYYALEDGQRATGKLTLKSGEYYFNESTGVMATGPVKIDGKYYLYGSDGKLVRSQKKGTYKTDANGMITSDTSALERKVLVVSGHGQGDGGATSSLGQESVLTRQFGKMVYDLFKEHGNVTVDYYQNGSSDYDLYQRNKAILGSLTSKIQGTGTYKTQLIQAMKASSVLPDVSDYDYVIEIHFNASPTSSKDLSGNGVCKGFMIYVNQYKSSDNRKVDQAIIANMLSLGYKQAWSGIVNSSTLLNARVCQEAGTPYSLIETAFVDDADDMAFYNKNKEKMAAAIVSAVENTLQKK